ncbi:MAG: diaminopimelate epimerase [candidate division KSB1 bacterium]|nr:diaminopimelate epimerase [candidate division KSB1 bacterium]MDZ7318766.1 diaminopimelate epimerase [candidate division KSB1 bacterium]MDZ7339857.1 diaminopimelate epimerase [candidate division KSB1 bacterium]
MIEFTKLSATGNDFILIDNRNGKFTGEEHDFFRQICQRRISVGADGILLLGRSDTFHFSLTYYNSDGFIGEMCGNGARAAAYYAVQQQLAPADLTFDVLGVPYRASVHEHWVKLFMPPPKEIIEYPGVVEESDFAEGGYLNVGVPHYVLFVPNVEKVDVETMGRKYRHHQWFQPWGTNVNFVEVVDPQTLRMRTYERGVEAETLACGTGTISAAILARRQKQIALPINVNAKGGLLRADFDEPIHQIALEGEVRLVYYGQLNDIG